MPDYPDPNGGRMQAANDQEAAAQGWSPSMGTFGSDTYPNADLSGGTPAIGPSGPGGGGGGLGAISAGFAASAGMTQKQLDEQIREFDQTLEWQKQQWREKGLPELAIEQRAQDLEEQKFAELTSQAGRQQSWVEEQGRRQAALAEKAQADTNAIATGQLGVQQGQLQVQQGQLGVSQGQLGLDTLKTAATLTGPADWIKAANFNRGVAQSNLPSFISSLLSGQSTAPVAGVAPGSSMSAPNTMGNMAQRLGAGAGTVSAATPYTPVTAGYAPANYRAPVTPTQQFVGKANGEIGQVMSDGSIRGFQNMADFIAAGGSPAMAQSILSSPMDGPSFDMQASRYIQSQAGGPLTTQTPEQAWAAADPGTRAIYAQYNGGDAGGMAKYWRDVQGSLAAAQPATAQSVAAGSTATPTQGGTAAPGAGYNQSIMPAMAGFYAGAPSNDVSNSTNALARVYASGGASLGPQQLEGLTPTELSMFTGGGSDVGADVNGFLDQYKKSRIGQSAAMPGVT
jgi:hypothetical protein